VLHRKVHHGLHAHHGMGILGHHIQGLGRLDILNCSLEQEVIRSGEGKVAADRKVLLGRVGHSLHYSCFGESKRHGNQAGKS